MVEREERRARWERRLQAAAFVGALIILGGMLFAAAVVQHGRREQERPAAAPSPAPTAAFAAVDLAPRQRPAYPGPESGFPLIAQDDGSWAYRIGEPLDPARVGGDGTELGALFLGLTRRSSSAPWVQPVLAVSWTVAEDGLTYTFHLRRDVYWVRCDPRSRQVQRIRPVVAADAAFAIARALDPQWRDVPQRELLFPIAGAQERIQGDGAAALGVVAVDDFTLQVRLTEPTPDLPARLASPAAWPLPWDQTGEDWGEDWGRLWVDGPFCPLGWDAEGRLKLVSNPFLPAGLPPWSRPRAVGPPDSYP